MPEPSISQLALGNLARGDLGAVAQSFFNPDTLAPRQRKTVIDDLLPDNDTFYKKALSVITDPIILIGLGLHLAYPIARAGELFKFSEKVKGLNKLLIPGISNLQTPDSIFRGHRVLGQLNKAVEQTIDFQSKHATNFVNLIGKWEDDMSKLLGRSVEFGRREETLLGMHLDGLHKAGNKTLERFGMQRLINRRAMDATFNQAPWRDLAKGFRKGLDDMYDEAIRTLTPKQLEQMKKQIGADGVAASQIEFLEDFLPHISKGGKGQDFRRIAEAAASGDRERFIKDIGKVKSRHVAERANEMAPDVDDLRFLGDEFVNPDELRRLEGQIASRADAGAPIAQYTLRSTRSLTAYNNGLGRFHGFQFNGVGDAIEASRRELGRLADAGNPNARFMERALETYVDVIKNKHGPKQGAMSAAWESMRNSLGKSLEAIKGKAGSAQHKAVSKVQDFVMDGPFSSTKRADANIAGFFFTGAMGGNPSSAFLNSLQTFTTTGPLIGTSATAKGMVKAVQSQTKYFKLRLAGKSIQEATEAAYPVARRAGVVGEDFIQLMVRDGESALSRVRIGKTSIAEKAQNALLSMFTTTETLNRLTAFEGGLIKAARDGLRGAKATDFAVNVAKQTQFFSRGPLGTPLAFLKVPSSLRQFLSFTTRLGEFAGGTATVAGSASKAIPEAVPILGGRNPGTLGRMLLTAGLLRNAGQEFLNADLSNGLLFGGLPAPRERGPFAPLPVSPTLGLFGSVLSDFASGEFEETPKAAALLVPGGIAARRLTLFSQTAAQALGREFTDLNDVDENGLVPLFSSNGSLKGRFSKFQLMLKASGLPFGDIRATAQFSRRLRQQAQAVKGIRRSYINALLNNDPTKAERISIEYKRNFGMDLDVRPQDLEAARFRREVTQLERTARSVPGAEQKRVFFDSIRFFVAERASRFAQLGVDPSLLQPEISAKQIREGGFRGTAPEVGVGGGFFSGGPIGSIGSGRFSGSRNPQTRQSNVPSLIGSPTR